MNRFFLLLSAVSVGLSICACKSDPQGTPVPLGGAQSPATPPATPLPTAPPAASGVGAPSPAVAPQPAATQPATPSAALGQPGVNATAPVQQIPGYIYIPPGPFKLGTAEASTPRCAGNEPLETDITLGGFYIQQYPVPGPGKPPVANVTWDQAKAACEAVNARLCTEIEWERACKGTDNSVYPYNAPWNPALCAVSNKSTQQPPLGTFAGCVTEEGVHDMIGNVWEWTSSTWGIPGEHHSDRVLRGGWKGFGRIANRCSHRYRAPHDKATARLGYRCCYGPVNPQIVSVPQQEAPLFESVRLRDRGIEEMMRDLLPRINVGQKYQNIRRMEGNDNATVWRPEPNIDIVVSKLEYDRRDASRGGTLLVFTVQRADKTQRAIAVFDRPEIEGDHPRFYARGNKETKEMQIGLGWKDKKTGREKKLTSKATYDCGMIKIIPTEWITHGESELPKSVPYMKTLIDMKNP